MRSFRLKNNKKPIVIWGASVYGEIAYKMITKVYHANVFAIVDNKYSQVDWTDSKIIRSSELSNMEGAQVLICAANSFNDISRQVTAWSDRNIEAFDICELLREYKELYLQDRIKFTSSYLYGDIDLDEIIERYEYYAGKNNEYADKLYLSYCVLCITSRCTLKCKNCAAFITRYEEKQDYSLKYVKDNFCKILEAVDGITELELMGGEPFVCAEFDEILSWCIEQEKIRAIKIVTNGSVFPREETWRLLENAKVKLVVDDYGKLSRHFDRIVDEAIKRDVRCEKQRLQTWYQIEPIVRHNFSEDSLNQIFTTCNFRTCIGMTNGRFYRCNVAGHMNTVGLLPDSESDYVQLQGKEWDKYTLRSELKTFLSKEHIQACDYCNLYKKQEIPVAEQL